MTTYSAWIGTNPNGHLTSVDLSRHIAVFGSPSSARDNVARALVVQAIRFDFGVVIADANASYDSFTFAKDHISVWARGQNEVADALCQVWDEVKRRRALLDAHTASHYTELPDDVRPRQMILVVTEQDLSGEAPYEIVSLVGKIVRESRAAGVTVLLSVGRLNATSLRPEVNDLKVNLGQRILCGGPATAADRIMALRNFNDAPDVPAWPSAAIFEPETGKAEATVLWNYTDDELTSLIAGIEPQPSTFTNKKRGLFGLLRKGR